MSNILNGKVNFLSADNVLMFFLQSFNSTLWRVLHFEKSSNTAKNLEKMKKNLSIILLLKWPLLQPKMFTVHCWFLSDISRYSRANTFSPLFSTLKQKVFSPCLLCSTCRETIILCATLTQVQKECLPI